MYNDSSTAVARGGPCAPSIPSYPLSLTSPVKTFVQRPSLCKQIGDQLFPDPVVGGGGEQEPRIVSICGMGGAGKSQLARGYLREYRHRYDASFWIQAGDPESIGNDFVAIYHSIPDSTRPDLDRLAADSARVAVFEWLQARGPDKKWLFVFDGADHLDNKDDGYFNIRLYLPGCLGANIHILITSRSSIARCLSTLNGVTVGALATTEAADLFFKCSQIPPTREGAEADVERIVQELGCLALAVTIAGSYVAQTPRLSSNLPLYLDEYRQRQHELLQRQPRDLTDMYERSVMTVWETSYSAVDAQMPEACRVLTLLGFLHNEHISLELFRQEEGENSWVRSLDIPQKPGDDAVRLAERSFAILEQYSLLQRDSEDASYYSMHKLVHAWAYHREVKSGDEQAGKRFGVASLCILRDIARRLRQEAGDGGEIQRLVESGEIQRLVESREAVMCIKRKTQPVSEGGEIQMPDKKGWEVAWVSDLKLVAHLREGVGSVSQMPTSVAEDEAMLPALEEILHSLFGTSSYRSASSAARAVLQKRQNCLGGEPPDYWTCMAMRFLTSSLANHGKHKEAITILRTAMEEHSLGDQHPGLGLLRDALKHALEMDNLGNEIAQHMVAFRAWLDEQKAHATAQDAILSASGQQIMHLIDNVESLEGRRVSDNIANLLNRMKVLASELRDRVNELAPKRALISDSICRLEINEITNIREIEDGMRDGENLATLSHKFRQLQGELQQLANLFLELAPEIHHMSRTLSLELSQVCEMFAESAREEQVAAEADLWYLPGFVKEWLGLRSDGVV